MNTLFRQRLSFVTLALAAGTLGHTQNLVIDGGLEDTLKCPQTIGRFYHPTNVNERYIAQWRATTLASPDLHNLCGFNGYQPYNGDGYAGIILYDPTEYREYITALLDTTLQQGVCYYVEAWVALSSGSTVAVDEFQMHFSIGVPLDMSFPPPGPLPLTTHLQAATAPTLTTYQRISGFFTATGGENAITFGNFQDNANTTLTTVSSVGQVQSYYYIDDVTVTQLDLGPDQLICAGDSAVILPNIQNPDLTYSWSDGSNGVTTTVGTAGIVTLTISGNGSCSATDAVMIEVDPCLSIENATPITNCPGMLWYGQDGNGTHSFLSPEPMRGTTLAVFDMGGRMIAAPWRWQAYELTIEMGVRTDGIYTAVVRSCGGVRVERFVHRSAN